MLRAIERGWVQQEIQNAAYDYQRRVETGDAVVVGVNKFTRDNEPGVPTQRHDPDLERRQVERLQALRTKRSQPRWQQGIDAVTERARYRRQSDARHPRSRRKQLHRGRNRWYAPVGLWRVSPDTVVI